MTVLSEHRMACQSPPSGRAPVRWIDQSAAAQAGSKVDVAHCRSFGIELAVDVRPEKAHPFFERKLKHVRKGWTR
jgi:hypothetical protein